MIYQINIQLIKNKRLEKGYTLLQMANSLGLKGKTDYFRRESGETKFKSEELPIVCEVLDIDLKKIFVKTFLKSKRINSTAKEVSV